MFILAASEALARRNGDVAIMPEYGMHGVKTASLLDCFDYDFQYGEVEAPITFVQNGFHYEPIPYTKDIRLSGYFQSHKFFEDQEDHIRKMFTFKKEIREKVEYDNSFLLGLQKSGVDLCFIHVRRTDYLDFQDNHPQVGMEYYNRACDIIREATDGKGAFIVCSDDIEWCKKQFPTDCFFVEGQKDYEDLYLMSLCMHGIICNSTFGWWGAWLIDKPSPIIVAPKRWFGPAYSHWRADDLYLPNWIKI